MDIAKVSIEQEKESSPERENDLLETNKQVMGEKGRFFLETLGDNGAFEVLNNSDKYLDLGFAEGLFCEAAKLEPRIAYANLKKYVDQEWSKRVLLTAFAEDGLGIFPYIDNFANKPWAEEVLFMAAKKYSSTAVEWLHKYIDQPYAINILLLVANKSPYSILRFISKYKEEKVYIGVLKTAVDFACSKDPSAVFDYIKDLENIFGRTYSKKAIKKTIETKRKDSFGNVLRYSNFIKDYLGKDYLQNRISIEVENFNQEKSLFVLSYLPVLEKYAGGSVSELLNKIITPEFINGIGVDNVESVLKNIDRIQKYIPKDLGESLVKKSLEIASKHSPLYVLQYSKQLKGLISNFDKVVEKAARKTTGDIPWELEGAEFGDGTNSIRYVDLEFFDVYARKPYAKELIFTAIKKGLYGVSEVLESFSKYASENYAEEVLNFVAKNSPKQIFDHLEQYSKVPYIGKILETALDIDSTAAKGSLRYFIINTGETMGIANAISQLPTKSIWKYFGLKIPSLPKFRIGNPLRSKFILDNGPNILGFLSKI